MPAMQLSDRSSSGGCLSGDASLSDRKVHASDLAQTPEETRRPLVDRLHEWVTTVDHKRLGILYIVYALCFLVVGGIEATIMRIQLVAPHKTSSRPRSSTGCSRCTAPR